MRHKNREYCEDCVWFACYGYHWYGCAKKDGESCGPFDSPCPEFEGCN